MCTKSIKRIKEKQKNRKIYSQKNKERKKFYEKDKKEDESDIT